MNFRIVSLALLATALGLVAAPARAVAEPIAIIVDRDNPKTDISVDELKSLFLGKRGDWADGARVVPIDLDPSSPSRAVFLSQVMGMSASQFEQYWVDQKVRGQGSPPRMASSESTALKLVSRVRGAVAFVLASQVDASVRVLTVGGQSSGSPSYPLK